MLHMVSLVGQEDTTSTNPDRYHEVLPVKHESGNSHNMYAVAIMKWLPGTLASCICYWSLAKRNF